jgi:cytochrome c oxidase accessory protein FixG
MGSATLIDLKEKRGGGAAQPPPPAPGDEPVLYVRRKQIYPQLAHGRVRAIKWLALIATLAIYYVLPWLRWDRGDGAPDQAVLADFAGGRFYVFALEIWPQEVYYITGLLIIAALGLFMVTALFGRVWCGFACPQTVWTDLFLVVERFFEGDRNARMRLDKAPMSFKKAWRKTAKHAVWIAIAFATGGAFIQYWHDAPTLARDFFVGRADLSAYVFAALLTGTTYALAGTMREQVCTYLCPWPRIQAAMIDKDTLAVTYRSDRGDPRGAHKKGDTWEGRGDCIDCRQCVVVCPMGIDIRQGPQLECIQCGLCIDACDAVMKKVGRPTGLIAYDTDENVVRRWAKLKPSPFRPLRPRILVYGAVIVAAGALMLFGLATRANLEIDVLKDRTVPFVQLSTGEVRNAYTLKLVNKLHAARMLELHVEGVPGARVEVIGEGEAAPAATLHAEAGGVDRFRLLVTAPAGAAGADGRADMQLIVRDQTQHGGARATTRFYGPER